LDEMIGHLNYVTDLPVNSEKAEKVELERT